MGLQLFQFCVSVTFVVMTYVWTRGIAESSKYLLWQISLALSTTAATYGIVFIAHNDSTLDLFRACFVRPEVLIVQYWIAREVYRNRYGELANRVDDPDNDTSGSRRAQESEGSL